MDEPIDYPAEVVSDDGFIHRLRPGPIGRGGQGVVLRTTGRDTAVKLITDLEGRPLRVTDPAERDRFYRRLDNVRLLPVPDPDELHLAMPVALLPEPYIGYVMRLLDGMAPIGSLLAGPGVDLAGHYVAGGGLRRRLAILAKAATILARLHAVPVVYADVSPNNIFISEDPEFDEVWFIDADNLHYLSSSSGRIWTPGFGAPEVHRGDSGVNTLTDVHAFAVLAFLVLAQHHPFVGDYVEEDEGGWDSEGGEDRRELAYSGKVPWVHDESDRSNETGHGIPREMLLSPGLWRLFHATFGAGRTDPRKRPSMTSWVEGLLRAVDMAIECPGCRWSYYGNLKSCPICKAPAPGLVYVQARRWDPQLDEDEFDPASGRLAVEGYPGGGDRSRAPGREVSRPIWHRVMAVGRGRDNDQAIHRHVVRPSLFRDGDPVAFEAKVGRNTLTLTLVDDGEYHLVRPVGRQSERLRRDRPRSIPLAGLNDGWIVHCGPLDRPHRLLTFGYTMGDGA